jgi:hypothetical protein
MLKKMLFTAFVALLAFTSCKKDSDNNFTLLTTGKWKIIAETENGKDIFSSNPNCEKDNLLIFETSGTLNYDEGATKCKASDPQTEIAGTWALSGSDQKKLVLTETSSSAVTIDIIELSSSSMKWQSTEAGVVYTLTLTKA